MKKIQEEKVTAERQANEMRLTAENVALSEQNELLKKELAQLHGTMGHASEHHKNEINLARKNSFREGHSRAADELKKLWGSTEFAAEMMYGKFCLIGKSKLTTSLHRWSRADSQST